MGEGQQAEVKPARVYATVVGGALICFGLLGFFYSSSFARDDALVAEKALGLFYVNGWQNVLHLVAGMLGLAMAPRAARSYCLAAGAVWIVLAAGGFFGSHGGELVPSMGGLFPAGTANNILNLVLAVLGFGAFAASPTAHAYRSTKKPGGSGTAKRKDERPEENRDGAKAKPEERGDRSVGKAQDHHDRAEAIPEQGSGRDNDGGKRPKSLSKAKNRAHPKPKVDGEYGSIGKPRSASRPSRGSRRPIN